MIESYSYFSLSVSLTLYLSDNFGISDYKASPMLCPHLSFREGITQN